MAWGFAVVAALAAAHAPLHAQQSEPAANETGTVGPRELQDFSINGTVTQSAPQQPAPTPPATRPQAGQPAASAPRAWNPSCAAADPIR